MNEMSPPPIGHNMPPLAEVLAEETSELAKRAADLAAAVGRAAVTDDDTAGKGALLVKMMTTHRGDIDKARVARKEPFLEGGRAVDAHFKSIESMLATLDGKGKVIGGPIFEMMGKLDAYRRAEEAKVAAERHRLEEEARALREQAEAAERARAEAEQRASKAEAGEDAAKDREAAMAAEMESRQRQEQANALARQAEATKAAQIDSGMGVKAFARKTFRAEITDLPAALKHALKVDKAAIQTAVQGIYDRQVKAGVRELPGATVHTDTVTSVR